MGLVAFCEEKGRDSQSLLISFKMGGRKDSKGLLHPESEVEGDVNEIELAEADVEPTIEDIVVVSADNGSTNNSDEENDADVEVSPRSPGSRDKRGREFSRDTEYSDSTSDMYGSEVSITVQLLRAAIHCVRVITGNLCQRSQRTGDRHRATEHGYQCQTKHGCQCKT